jgi:hypothetical protein
MVGLSFELFVFGKNLGPDGTIKGGTGLSLEKRRIATALRQKNRDRWVGFRV